MPLAPGNSPYRLSKLQFSCKITTTWLSLFKPLALAAGADVTAATIAVGAAGTAGAVGAAACGLPAHAARMGSNSASSSSGENIFHRVDRFMRSFLSSSVSLDSCSDTLPTATSTRIPARLFPWIVFVEQRE
jgi:hypothetical protein